MMQNFQHNIQLPGPQGNMEGPSSTPSAAARTQLGSLQPAAARNEVSNVEMQGTPHMSAAAEAALNQSLWAPRARPAPRIDHLASSPQGAGPETSEDTAQSQEEENNPQVTICANCGLKGHCNRACVTALYPHGDIQGCYRCNDRSHIIDDCTMQPPLTDRDRYQIEVVERVGLPPLRSRQGWERLAIAMKHNWAGPISRQMMATLQGDAFRRDTLRRWNYNLPPALQAVSLVYDPATADLEHIRSLPSQGYVELRNNTRGLSQICNRPADQQQLQLMSPAPPLDDTGSPTAQDWEDDTGDNTGNDIDVPTVV
ncbi:hypothetical protein F5Y04DRAFT_278669 [Hypomontagnella monticulosa]|nr:hypothetical protein F5Y04DRAFT_278669 [Hypomontagnella monticulosa]